MKPYFRLSVFLFFLLPPFVFAQKDPQWDDTRSGDWPAEARKITVPSTADGSMQSAYFYAAPLKGPRPLVVSLHTWSGDYRQKDTLVNLCIERGYHYIHPDFRGPNNNPAACGSELVIQDIDDAISWAMAHAETDSGNVHVIGVSGGAYATLLTYMRSRHKIRSFSAYAGIYNLVDWYHESVGRKAKYAGDIAAATSGKRDQPDFGEARKRSPFFMDKPLTDRRTSKLALYCGIHDGYTGSVPINQSFRMYNKLVSYFNPQAPLSLVPEELIQLMTRERTFPGNRNNGTLLGRKIHYSNNLDDLVSLTVFEGGHEMPPGDALAHIPARTLLAIGDSNGAADNGWVNQLKKQRPSDYIFNTCISGNTIGFDNLGKKELNTLKNIDSILAAAPKKTDAVLIMLGTNDSKTVFDARQAEVPVNLEKLLKKIREKIPAPVFVISPPPFGEDSVLGEKYKGGAQRVSRLKTEFRKVAERNNCYFIDAHSPLLQVFRYLSTDGVHLTSEGQTLLASLINSGLRPVLEAGKPGPERNR